MSLFPSLRAAAGVGLLAILSCMSTHAVAATGTSAEPRITVLYDAFGDDASLTKDWGFAALVEAGGKRILFDTGNDAEVFAHNVKAKGVDLSRLDAVVMSHRHADHMAGLGVVLAANPDVTIYAPQEGFGIYGSSLPASFYRKDETLPARQRYFDGKPPETLQFGSAWPGATFKPLSASTEIAPGVHVIAQVSDKPGTLELRELSLAIETEQGLVLVVGCSHPGIAAIVAEAAKIGPKIHLVVGGFHFVNADDAAVAGLVAALQQHDVRYIAPGHCTGEATFAALQKAFGERYVYAGLGAELDIAAPGGPTRPRGVALMPQERDAYRVLAVQGEHAHSHAHLADATAH